MIISLIVAMDRNRGIGIENRLPWRLPDDMKRFRRLTMGHHLLVGRKTFASIGKALPGRTMIILTRNPAFTATGCLVVHSIEQAIEIARTRGENELFIGGGSELYRETIPLAARIYLTEVDAEMEVDTYFPELDLNQWNESHVEIHPADERHSQPILFRPKERRT